MFRFDRKLAFLLTTTLTVTSLMSVTTGCKKTPKDGSGSPTPTPTASASPSPTQNPRADLSPSCKRIAEGTGTGGAGCKALDNKYLPYIKAAQAGVPRSHFNGAGQVRNVSLYADAIIDFLDRTHNLCAFWDGQKLMIRDGTNSNEYYRLFSPNRVADPFLRTTCAPAQRFGTRNESLDPYNADPDCPLPVSNADESAVCESAGDAVSPNKNNVNGALDDVIQEQRAAPTFMKFKDGESRVEWVLKDKEQAYFARIVEKLHTRGLCATQDGGQGVSIKPNNSNARSEFWALRVLGQVDEQEAHPIWRKFHGSCYPAEF